MCCINSLKSNIVFSFLPIFFWQVRAVSYIRLLKPNKNINGKLSFCKNKRTKKKKKKCSPRLYMSSAYFIKIMFELLFKVFSQKN